MVLQETDEGGGSKLATWLAAPLAAPKGGHFALIDKSRRERPGEIVNRRTLIIAVVALRFAGQQDMPGVVIVIVPLPAIFATRRVPRRVPQDCAGVAVFEPEKEGAPGLRGYRTGRPPGVAQGR